VAWTNKPDENDLPSDILSTTPRDGNAEAEYDHHTHHNSLADSVKTIIDEIDAAIGTSTTLDERLGDLTTTLNQYKTMAIVYTNGNLTGTGASVISSAGASATPSTLLPGETLAASDKLLVFHTNTISSLISGFGGTVQGANLLFYLFMCPMAAPSGVYTVQNNGSWTRDAVQPSVGDFFSFSTSSYFAGSIFNVISINNLGSYYEGDEGDLILPEELDGTYAMRTNLPFLSNTVIDRFDGEIPSWLGGSFTSQGGGGGTTININGDPSYLAEELLPFPAEDISYDPVNDPFPEAVSQVGKYDNKYILFVDQDLYPNGIYKAPANAHLDPLEFIEDLTQDEDNIGKVIRVATGNYSGGIRDIVVSKNQTGTISYQEFPSTVKVLTVYDTDVDISSPPLSSDDITPVTDITGRPVPILLNNQTDTSENGLYYATASRATVSTFMVPEAENIAVLALVGFGENGDFSSQGLPYVWSAGYGWGVLSTAGSPGPTGATGATGAAGPAGADGTGVVILEANEAVPAGLPAGTKILRRPAV
jgi:hypothetical protein